MFRWNVSGARLVILFVAQLCIINFVSAKDLPDKEVYLDEETILALQSMFEIPQESLSDSTVANAQSGVVYRGDYGRGITVAVVLTNEIPSEINAHISNALNEAGYAIVTDGERAKKEIPDVICQIIYETRLGITCKYNGYLQVNNRAVYLPASNASLFVSLSHEGSVEDVSELTKKMVQSILVTQVADVLLAADEKKTKTEQQMLSLQQRKKL